MLKQWTDLIKCQSVWDSVRIWSVLTKSMPNISNSLGSKGEVLLYSYQQEMLDQILTHLDTEGAPILRSNTNLLILPLLVSAAQP